MRAYLSFEDGSCIGLNVRLERKSGPVTQWAEADVPELVARGLLSLTDRMILNQIAARVDKLVRQLDAS